MKYSLFIQPLGLTVDQIHTMMDHVKQVRDTPGGDDVQNIVIDLMADAAGNIPWPQIDAIVEYAPGGTKRAMSNLFVGTGILPAPAGGSPYREGVKDAAYRQRQKDRTFDLASAFAQRYTGKVSWWHWYISYEAVLNWWGDKAIADGYEALLKDQVSALHAARPETSILWSPAFWNPTLTTGTVANIRRVLAHVPEINWLHFQDMGGRDWVGATPAVVKRYYDMFKSIGTLRSVRIDVEMFEHTPTYYGPGDPTEVRDRMQTYVNMGMPLGASFEIRYWYEIEKKLRRPGEDPLAVLDVTPPVPSPARAPWSSTKTYKPTDGSWADASALVPPSGGTLREVVVTGIYSA